MYQFLSFIIGVVIAVMISVNGTLSGCYDTFRSAVIIHVVGVIFATILYCLKKEKKPLLRQGPLWIYLGGALGFLTTVFNNFSFEYISMTSIVALGLFGQMLTSAFVDSLGLLGMEKYPFRKSSLLGFCFALIGVASMLDFSISSSLLAVLLSIGGGITVVLSRTVNARLSEKTGALGGSLINHLVGLPITILFALLFVPRSQMLVVNPTPLWAYFGGMLGVTTVLLFNIVVPKISALNLSILSFIGQLFTGILLDVLAGNDFSNATFTGGIIISIGMLLNFILDAFHSKKTSNRRLP